MEFEKIGRYQVKGRIGKGGMATIFLAHDPLFGRDVAIKVLPREFLHDPSFRGRFEREARTIATLEHPAIVPVYDFGEEDGQPYLVMRYMRGGALADRLHKGPISVAEAAHILERIGSALDHAHAKGIVHRDLKPGNILFDEYGEPFLADFGIVKIAEATATYTSGGIIGTPAYMSPEQVHGDKNIDGRSDIYTLGVILFEMLTGQMPYRADTPAKLMMAHVLNPTPRILDYNPNLPDECNAVISTAMAKDPDQRFTTATQMARMLTTTTQTSSPVIAQPPAQAPTVRESSPEMPAVPPPAGPPPGTAAAASSAGAAGARPRPAEPPVFEPSAPPAVAASAGGRNKWLFPAIGGLIALFLCCGIGFLALTQLGGDDTTPTPPLSDADGTATALALAGVTLTPTATTTRTPTPTREVDVAATEAAQQATAQALDATATARALALAGTATAEAAAEATEVAIADATVAAETTVDAQIGALRNAIAALQQQAPVFAPTSGSLLHLEDGFIESEYAGVTVSNFAVEATFQTPYNRLLGTWDAGFMFRDTGVDDQYRLAIESTGFWSLGNRTGDDFELLDEGELDNINIADGSENTLLLYVQGAEGYVFLNDEFITELDLSARTAAGDIAVAIGLYEGNEVEGEETGYTGFTIWSAENVGAAAPTATTAVAAATTAPNPTSPPANVTAQLLGSMRGVRTDLQSMGGMIDNAVNTGSVDCLDVIATYDRIVGAPFYNNLSGQDLNAHNSYRASIDTFNNGSRDMYQNCVDFVNSGGGGSIPFQQWGTARQSVNQALDILNPAIANLENA